MKTFFVRNLDSFTKFLLKNFGYLNKEYYEKLKSGGLSNVIGFVEAGK